jgi:hypothetical protein
MKKHNALARRLPGRQDDYLRFTLDFRIPADSNGSERDIRMPPLRTARDPAAAHRTGRRELPLARRRHRRDPRASADGPQRRRR